MVRPQQDYCDWCFGALSDDARRRSCQLGLPLEDSWACGDCLATGRYRQAPEAWHDEAHEWPAGSVFHLDEEELRAIVNALNEVLHGPESIEAWEFETRMGLTQQQALKVFNKLRPRL